MGSQSRTVLWTHFLRAAGVRRMVKLGGYRGGFAPVLLNECGFSEKYYMIDPWRHLADWNKPANACDDVFERSLSEATAKIQFAAGQRAILRGTTTEVIEDSQDGELDFAYIDGDHTLQGIAIDLIRVFPRIRPGDGLGEATSAGPYGNTRCASSPPSYFRLRFISRQPSVPESIPSLIHNF